MGQGVREPRARTPEAARRYPVVIITWIHAVERIMLLASRSWVRGFGSHAHQVVSVKRFAELLPRVIAGHTAEQLPVPVAQSLADTNFVRYQSVSYLVTGERTQQCGANGSN